jgi:hypothetical protein
MGMDRMLRVSESWELGWFSQSDFAMRDLRKASHLKLASAQIKSRCKSALLSIVSRILRRRCPTKRGVEFSRASLVHKGVEGFLNLKGSKAKDIETRHEEAYEDGTLKITTVQKSQRFLPRRIDLHITHGLEDASLLIFVPQSAKYVKCDH